MKCDVVVLTKAANGLIYKAVEELAVHSRDSIGTLMVCYTGDDQEEMKKLNKLLEDIPVDTLLDYGEYNFAYLNNQMVKRWAAVNFQKNAVIGPFNTQNLNQVQPLELNHYAIKTWDECLAKCSRGRADFSVKRNAEQLFRKNDKNDIENDVSKNYLKCKL